MLHQGEQSFFLLFSSPLAFNDDATAAFFLSLSSSPLPITRGTFSLGAELLLSPFRNAECDTHWCSHRRRFFEKHTQREDPWLAGAVLAAAEVAVRLEKSEGSRGAGRSLRCCRSRCNRRCLPRRHFLLLRRSRGAHSISPPTGDSLGRKRWRPQGPWETCTAPRTTRCRCDSTTPSKNNIRK